MLGVEQIDEWRGQDVLDREGEKLGKLDDVYYDTANGEAAFLTIKSGLLGRRSHLVPVAQASVGREYVRVAFTSEQVAKAETSDTDGVLDGEAARRAVDVYGVRVGDGSRFESARLIEQRHADAKDAREQADKLDKEARDRADRADEARRRAHEANDRASDADGEAKRTREAAEDARTAADRAEDASSAGPGAGR